MEEKCWIRIRIESIRIHNPGTMFVFSLLQSESNQMRYLVNWVPRLRNKRLYVEGDILDLSEPIPDTLEKRWVTSKIVRRVSIAML
jgi:hypothetical protein